jgi:hypothetical protein
MKCTWISSLLVSQRLIFVLDEILYMAHLVVSSEEIFHVNPGTLFDPAE